MHTVSLLKWGIRMNFTVQRGVRGEGKRERPEDKARGRNSTGVINGNAEERDSYSPGKNGPPSLIFQGYRMEVMKINTLIITILKIKIEDSTFVVLIFKCLRYIDQHNPVFFAKLVGVSLCGEEKKRVLQEVLLKILIKQHEEKKPFVYELRSLGGVFNASSKTKTLRKNTYM